MKKLTNVSVTRANGGNGNIVSVAFNFEGTKIERNKLIPLVFQNDAKAALVYGALEIYDAIKNPATAESCLLVLQALKEGIRATEISRFFHKQNENETDVYVLQKMAAFLKTHKSFAPIDFITKAMAYGTLPPERVETGIKEKRELLDIVDVCKKNGILADDFANAVKVIKELELEG